MNSIEEKKNKSIHEVQFEKWIQETKKQIEQIRVFLNLSKYVSLV